MSAEAPASVINNATFVVVSILFFEVLSLSYLTESRLPLDFDLEESRSIVAVSLSFLSTSCVVLSSLTTDRSLAPARFSLVNLPRQGSADG